MANVIVDKEKIDILANAISAKSGEAVTMTLDEMVEAVDSIKAETVLQSKSVNITPSTSAQTNTITADTGYDGLEEVDINVRAVPTGQVVGRTGVLSASNSAVTYTSTQKKMIVYGFGVDTSPTLAREGYVDGINSTTATVQVTTSIDVNPEITASGATVTVPNGYYDSAKSKTVASGIAGTPTATKGSVSNHSISVTPSVTNTEGYISGGTKTGDPVTVTASELVSGTIVASTAGDLDVTEYATARIEAGTAGFPTATKGTVSNNSVTVTPYVTNTTGFITGGTKQGTAVSVSASELVSGTLTVSQSGNSDVTNYATVSVPSGTAGTPTATKGTVSNHSVTVTPSVTNQTGWITGGTTSGTGVTVTASELESGNLAITQNGTGIDVSGYATVSVDVQGGGSSGMQVGVISQPTSHTSSLMTFTGLQGQPTSFVIEHTGSGTLTPSATQTLVTVVYDGTDVWGQKITNTSNAQVSYTGDEVYCNYGSGTLEVVSVNPSTFDTDSPYTLTYTYGGSSTNIGTKQVQVGSGATSITFTGLEDEPDYFSCGFLGNFGTSSGYQRVISVVYDGSSIYGLEMDSGVHYSTAHWSYTYNNGSLTISSQGTNAGGYFHQPSSYQLTYGIGGDQSLQTKTVTPTTSTQNVTADTGYTALKKVVVNPIPSSYVQPTATQGATTYRASTTQQTIASGTYLSGTQTIAPVSQTNLTADNIKSGTTISISNGQSNIWSVTGTYSGGGGGSSSIGTTTTTNNSNTATSISFTNLSGQPQAFFVRLTSQVARSSSNRYYYVINVRYNGTNTQGNKFYQYNGTYSAVTSGYSYTYSNNTLTVSSNGSQSSGNGSFYNGTYELVYIY